MLSWTRADLETACRQLGFQGGRWWSWMDRRWPAKPRLLYEQPGCRGTESSLTSCERWSERQLGGGVCGTVLTEPINVDVVVAFVKDHRHRTIFRLSSRSWNIVFTAPRWSHESDQTLERHSFRRSVVRSTTDPRKYALRTEIEVDSTERCDRVSIP